MRNSALCFLALLSCSVTTAKTFEGIVHFQLTSGKRTTEMQYAIKGDRMLTNMSLDAKHSSSGLYDSKTGEMFVFMPEQKMYMVFGGMDRMVKNATPTNATIEETGRIETIAGYKCSEYIIKDKDSTSELWATKGLGRFVSLTDVQKSRGKNPGWAQVLVDKELFPLRTINKNRSGRVVAKMEATKVEAKELDPEMFEIPADYQRLEMPNLGGLLKGLGG